MGLADMPQIHYPLFSCDALIKCVYTHKHMHTHSCTHTHTHTTHVHTLTHARTHTHTHTHTNTRIRTHTHTQHSTCHRTYVPPVQDQRPHPLRKHQPLPKANGIGKKCTNGNHITPPFPFKAYMYVHVEISIVDKEYLR